MRRSPVSFRQATNDQDADPGTLAQAIDQTLDAALEAYAAGEEDQGWQLVTAACATVDALLAALSVPDTDEGAGQQEADDQPPAGESQMRRLQRQYRLQRRAEERRARVLRLVRRQ